MKGQITHPVLSALALGDLWGRQISQYPIWLVCSYKVTKLSQNKPESRYEKRCLWEHMQIVFVFVCVEALRPSQPYGVMSSVVSYLTTLLLGRLSPLNQYCTHSFTRNWQLPFLKGQNDCRKYFMINLHERMLLTRRGSNPQPLDLQSDTHPNEQPRPAYMQIIKSQTYQISCTFR